METDRLGMGKGMDATNEASQSASATNAIASSFVIAILRQQAERAPPFDRFAPVFCA
jgi:hypothetical protein